MKRKILLSLVAGSFLLCASCNPRQVDDGLYTSGQSGAMDEATATERAETTVATTDTAAILFQIDSAAVNKRERL